MTSVSQALSNIDWQVTGTAIWAFVNTPIVCALLPATIAAVLAQRVNLVVQQNVASLDAARAAASAQDQLGVEPEGTDVVTGAPSPDGASAPSPRPQLSEEENRRLDAGAASVQSIKAYVDRTAQSVPDGRRRRKYNNIPRHDYRVLVLALAEDGVIPNEDASRLNHAFSLWRRFQRRRTPVPEFVVSELRTIEREFSNRR
jgi:hypothetical protein